MTFVEMFSEVCERHSGKVVAAGIGYSEQYVSNLRQGARLPSVAVVDAICNWMGRGPNGRRDWHVAGAGAHGWKL